MQGAGRGRGRAAAHGRGQDAVYCAAQLGSLGCVELLLARGSASDVRDAFGMTPLYAAAQNGHAAVVDVLSRRGAVEVADDEGTRPLPSSSWQRVPSKSRPGEWSYLHVPSGLRQRTFPTDDPAAAAVGAPVAPVALPQERSTALLHNMHILLEVVHLYSCVPAKQRALATNLEHVFAACIEVLPESGLSHLQTVFLKEIVPVVRGTLASLQ